MTTRAALYFGAHRLVGSRLGEHFAALRKADQERRLDAAGPAALTRLLQHCQKAVPYYAELLSQAPGGWQVDPAGYLPKLPILTKALIRQNFEGLKARDLGQRRWTYNTSGGSTGEPVRFIQDREYTDRQSATQLLTFDWAGRPVCEPALRVWGSERDILQGSVGLKMRLLNWVAQEEWFNAFRMTPAAMRNLLAQLNRRRYRLIIAYAQALYEIARLALKEGIEVAPQAGIVTSAGTLYPFMRTAMEQAFGCQVFNRYGSREVGDIAAECAAHEGLHVLGHANYVEVVDDAGQPVADGTEGNLVITCLSNYAMPLLRYAIGDRGRLSLRRTCACGRSGQILEHISGRNVDTFRTRTGTLIDGEYFTHLMYFRAWVEKFQVVQESATLIRYRVVKTGGQPGQGELDDIRDKTRAVMGSECEVVFEFVDAIPEAASGKYRYTISNVAPE
jgi:phenylacetate-CoA ligase